MEKKRILKEYLWAYDWWLTYQIEGEDFERHRINWCKIVSIKQENYWPVKFICENWETFINLRKIDEKNNTWGIPQDIK